MKIQGPWGAEGVMHIFTALLATSSTANEHITVSVYSYLSENATIKKKRSSTFTQSLACANLHATAMRIISNVTSMDVIAL